MPPDRKPRKAISLKDKVAMLNDLRLPNAKLKQVAEKYGVDISVVSRVKKDGDSLRKRQANKMESGHSLTRLHSCGSLNSFQRRYTAKEIARRNQTLITSFLMPMEACRKFNRSW